MHVISFYALDAGDFFLAVLQYGACGHFEFYPPQLLDRPRSQGLIPFLPSHLPIGFIPRTRFGTSTPPKFRQLYVDFTISLFLPENVFKCHWWE